MKFNFGILLVIAVALLACVGAMPQSGQTTQTEAASKEYDSEDQPASANKAKSRRAESRIESGGFRPHLQTVRGFLPFCKRRLDGAQPNSRGVSGMGPHQYAGRPQSRCAARNS